MSIGTVPPALGRAGRLRVGGQTHHSGDTQQQTEHHVQFLPLEPENGVVVLSNSKVLPSQPVRVCVCVCVCMRGMCVCVCVCVWRGMCAMVGQQHIEHSHTPPGNPNHCGEAPPTLRVLAIHRTDPNTNLPATISQ